MTSEISASRLKKEEMEKITTHKWNAGNEGLVFEVMFALESVIKNLPRLKPSLFNHKIQATGKLVCITNVLYYFVMADNDNFTIVKFFTFTSAYVYTAVYILVSL